MKAPKATAPIAIPAIAPFDSPLLELAAGDAVELGVPDVEEAEVDVRVEVAELVVKVIWAVIVGNTTPAHRCSAPEL